MSRSLIAIDVDGVVVDTTTPFIAGGSKADFWRNPRLYDGLTPGLDVRWALARLRLCPVEMIFVTFCFAEHLYSKFRFLRRHFPNIPMISIEEKWLIPADVLIDDRAEMYRPHFERYGSKTKLFTATCDTILSVVTHEVIPYVRTQSRTKLLPSGETVQNADRGM